jgi:hypothetical protein
MRVLASPLIALTIALCTVATAKAQQSTDVRTRAEEDWRRDEAVRRAAEYSTGPLTPLKVQVTITRIRDNKQISSLPYTLSVNANDKDVASLRVGAQVALPAVSFPSGPGVPSVYKDIGTYIDCTARTMEDGRFRLRVSIEDSSIYAGNSEQMPQGQMSAPAIRSFKLSNTAVLQDGQSTQFTSAADKLTGEIAKIDISLTVLKFTPVR